MGMCGQPGYVFWDLCLKQGNKFITFCLNQGIGLSIFYCPRKDILFKTGYLKQGRKISEIYLKQGQGMRGRAAPPNPRIYRVPPPPPGRFGDYCKQQNLDISLLWNQLPNVCLDSFVNEICEGNALYEESYVDTAVYLHVQGVVNDLE